MKKWMCILAALLLLCCAALAENSLNGYPGEGADGNGSYTAAGGALLESVGVRVGIAALIALIIAFVCVNAMKAKLRTARQRSGASNYAQEGSFELGVKQDRFLYERTERRRVQTSQPSSGGGRPQGGGNTRGGGANRLR